MPKKPINPTSPDSPLTFEVNGTLFFLCGIGKVNDEWVCDVQNLTTKEYKCGVELKKISKYLEYLK